MATHRTVTLAETESLMPFVPKERRDEVSRRLCEAVAKGRTLTLEESSFSDLGADYSALYIEGEPTSVIYVPGY